MPSGPIIDSEQLPNHRYTTTFNSIYIEEIVMLHHGLYEQVINNALTSELAEIPEARKAIAPIDKAEASKVLAQYLADVVQKGLQIAPRRIPIWGLPAM